jgi:hypothetical protein
MPCFQKALAFQRGLPKLLSLTILCLLIFKVQCFCMAAPADIDTQTPRCRRLPQRIELVNQSWFLFEVNACSVVSECLYKFLVPARSPTRHLDPRQDLVSCRCKPQAQPGHSIRRFRRLGGAWGCPLSQKSVIRLTLENTLDTTPLAYNLRINKKA